MRKVLNDFLMPMDESEPLCLTLHILRSFVLIYVERKAPLDEQQYCIIIAWFITILDMKNFDFNEPQKS